MPDYFTPPKGILNIMYGLAWQVGQEVSRGVGSGEFCARPGLDKLVVYEQTSRLRVLQTIWGNELN